MKPHLLDQEVIDMILRHATECIGTDGVDGLRGHILTLTALLAAIAAHDSELAKELEKVKGERDRCRHALVAKCTEVDVVSAERDAAEAENARLRAIIGGLTGAGAA